METDILTLVGIAAGGFIIGILALAVILKMTALGMMVHEAKSPYDFDTTVDTIVTNAEKEGWKISKVYDFQKSAMDAGKGDIGKINVIQMCQIGYAEGLLKKDDTKYVAVMMPCSVAIYEKSDGATYIASMNMGRMGKIFGGDIDRTMSKVARDDKKILGFVKQ